MRHATVEEKKQTRHARTPAGGTIRDAMEFSAELRRRGRKVGSVVLGDERGLVWNVKVRHSKKGARFLLVEPVGRQGPRIRAAADPYRPKKFMTIEPSTWITLARLAAEKHDWPSDFDRPELMSSAREELNHLVRQAREKLKPPPAREAPPPAE